jgi:hypothetical protein
MATWHLYAAYSLLTISNEARKFSTEMYYKHTYELRARNCLCMFKMANMAALRYV